MIHIHTLYLKNLRNIVSKETVVVRLQAFTQFPLCYSCGLKDLRTNVQNTCKDRQMTAMRAMLVKLSNNTNILNLISKYIFT